MCRIFLLWKTTNVTKSDIISLLEHSKDPDKQTSEYTNTIAKDGYGLAGYSSQTHRWNLYKTLYTYETDPNFSRELDRITKYSFVIGHMRKRPKWSSLTVENNHPFYYKNNVFLQYGNIYGLETARLRALVIKTLLPEFVPNIQGTTDTELLFYLFLTKIRETDLDIESVLSSNTCAVALRKIYLHHRENYKRLCVLYTAIYNTLEYLHRHFIKITTNIIFSNKQYTMVLRHQYAKPPHKITTHNTLYWNNPRNDLSQNIIITTRPEGDATHLISDNTLVFIENTSGKTFVVGVDIP